MSNAFREHTKMENMLQTQNCIIKYTNRWKGLINFKNKNVSGIEEGFIESVWHFGVWMKKGN